MKSGRAGSGERGAGSGEQGAVSGERGAVNGKRTTKEREGKAGRKMSIYAPCMYPFDGVDISIFVKLKRSVTSEISIFRLFEKG